LSKEQFLIANNLASDTGKARLHPVSGFIMLQSQIEDNSIRFKFERD